MAVSGTGFNSAVSPYSWIVQTVNVLNNQVVLSAAPNGTPSGSITFSVPYYPEVSGLVSYNSYGTRQITTNYTSSSTFAFRLPLPTDGVNYVVNYIYRSTYRAISRRGSMTIMCDVVNNNVQLSDEYDYTGDDTYNVSLAFTARIVANSLEIDYVNSATSDTGFVMYSYSAVL